jgi:predicted HNH restriction endonuclease
MDIGGNRKCLSRNDIEVHHLTYVRFGNELMTDLATLCHDCHKRLHQQQELKHGKGQ